MGQIFPCCCSSKKKKEKSSKTKPKTPIIASEGKSWMQSDSQSLIPSQIPDSAVTKEYRVPSDEYKNLDYLYSELGLEIKGKIGNGSYGTVYRGLRLADNKDIAIKVMDLSHSSDTRHAKLFNCFRNEIFIMAKKPHKNMIALYQHFIVNDCSYIVMEFANGGNLKNALRRRVSPYSEDKAKQYFSSIAAALEHMHNNGYAHRDLKLDNILISNIGGEEVIKVSDFGISGYAIENDRLVRTSKPMGTVSYMSPQVIQNLIKRKATDAGLETPFKVRKYDFITADIWSLGVCLLVMLSKPVTYPFGRETKTIEGLIEMYAKQKESNYMRPENVSKQCLSLIEGMLEVNEINRITIQDVCAHVWVNREDTDSSTD